MISWQGRHVFVTGGNGFLGSHIVRRLVDAGADVTCLVRRPCARAPFYLDGTATRVRCEAGVLTDLSLLRRILAEQRIDTVFHLAAQPIVGESVRDPYATVDTNVFGTLNVLEAARQWGGLRALVTISSDKVYGDSDRLPYREDYPLNGIGPYDASKVCVDVLARTYARTYGLPVAVVRAGNFYGPGDRQWSRLVPGTIRSLLVGERPVIRSDGMLSRDYFYVEDAADALIMLGAALDRAEVRGEAFNFGTGVAESVSTVVRMIIERSGRRVEPIVLGDTRGEIRDQFLDCTKVRLAFGWEYRTALAEGLDRAWVWYERYLREAV